jgi:hypothetical protein
MTQFTVAAPETKIQLTVAAEILKAAETKIQLTVAADKE